MLLAPRNQFDPSLGDFRTESVDICGRLTHLHSDLCSNRVNSVLLLHKHSKFVANINNAREEVYSINCTELSNWGPNVSMLPVREVEFKN